MSNIRDVINTVMDYSDYIPVVSTVTGLGKVVVGAGIALVNSAKLSHYSKKLKIHTYDKPKSYSSNYSSKAGTSEELVKAGKKAMKKGIIVAIPILGNIYALKKSREQSVNINEMLDRTNPEARTQTS